MALVLQKLKPDGNPDNNEDWEVVPCPNSGSLTYDIGKGSYWAKWLILYRHTDQARLTDGENVPVLYVWYNGSVIRRKGPEI